MDNESEYYTINEPNNQQYEQQLANTNRLPAKHINYLSNEFNLIAFKYSFKTQSDNKAGNFIEAKRHSKLAKKFNLITTVFLCVVYLLVISAVLFVAYFNYESKIHKLSPTTAAKSQSFQAPNKTIPNVTQAIVGSWRLVIICYFP